MIFHLYLLLAAAALISFLLGIRYGSLGAGAATVGDDGKASYVTKIFLTVMLLLFSTVLFFILASASYDIRIPHCDTSINGSVAQPDNVTTLYTHTTDCTFTQYTDETVGDFFMIMGWASVIVMIIYVVKDLTGIAS